MAEDLRLLQQLGLCLPNQELQERFLGIPISQVLDDAVEELGSAVDERIGNAAFLSLAHEHMDKLSQYLQYIISQALLGNRLISISAGRQDWPPDQRDRLRLGIGQNARYAHEGENISYRGTVLKLCGRLYPLESTLYVDVPDQLGRYTRRYEFTNHVYIPTDNQTFTLSRTRTLFVDDEHDSAVKSSERIINWREKVA